jgi:hypothetical protein
LSFFVFSYLIFFRVPYILFCFYIDGADDGEEEEEPEAHGLAPTSTSNALILSKEHRVALEAPPPPRHDPKALNPVPSPRASKPKKMKTGAASTQELATGSTSSPLLEDIIFFCLLVKFFRFTGKIFYLLALYLFLVIFFTSFKGAGQLGLAIYRVPRRGRDFKR